MALSPAWDLSIFGRVFAFCYTRISPVSLTLDPSLRPLALIMQSHRHEKEFANQMDSYHHFSQSSGPFMGLEGFAEGG